MATAFHEKSIEQLCTRVTTGATPLRSRSDFYEGGTTDWFKTGELKDWYLGPAEERITEMALEETSVKLFPANTVLMAMYGDGRTITSLGMLRKSAATNQACCAMLVDEEKCDTRYFFYALKGRRHLLLKVASGGAQRNLSGKVIKEFELPVPPLPMQRRIAGILSAYDELIENNQRRIRILEAMARALYREWFVHFRFPGHEKLPRVSSPLGGIPQGWEVKCVPECVDISPRVAVPRDGEKPFVPMGCLSNDSMLITDIESREGNSGAKFQNGDTLFARITPCLENGKTGFVQFLPDAQAVGFGSTEFIVLRSRTLTPEFVYLLARSDEFRGIAIKSMSGATGRQRVQEQCFDDFQVVQPPRAFLDRFSATVAPSFRLIYKLHLQIQNLRRTRDLLLPRLLSGQVNLRTN
jgi:type I restriction enzyme, S subunit